MPDHPCGCSEKPLTISPLCNSYGAWIEDWERRHRAGQRQVYCAVCGKWRWPDEVGPKARTVTAKQFAKLAKEAEAMYPEAGH